MFVNAGRRDGPGGSPPSMRTLSWPPPANSRAASAAPIGICGFTSRGWATPKKSSSTTPASSCAAATHAASKPCCHAPNPTPTPPAGEISFFVPTPLSEMLSSTFRDSLFLLLGAGVTRAQGGVEPTAGSTLNEVDFAGARARRAVPSLRRELLRRHLAIAVELRAFVEHQARRADIALHSRRRHQLDAFARGHFAAECAGDRHLARADPRTHDRAGRDHDFVAADLTFRFAFDFHRAAKGKLARGLGAFADS